MIKYEVDVCPSGSKLWYLSGKNLTEGEHRKATNPRSSCEGKVVEVDGVKYQLKEVR